MGCVIVLYFVVRYFMSILVLQSSWWGREITGCFAYVIFLVSHDCCVGFSHSDMGLSADCDISLAHN